jgi:hypothetical protein
MIRNGGRLIVAGDDGIEREVARSDEIIQVAWFPDSQHIIYVDSVPSDNPLARHDHRIWIANVGYVLPYEIADGFSPLVSPDGRHVAFILGNRAGDACIVAYGLGIIRLDDEFLPVSLIRQADVSGIPIEIEEDYHSFIPDVSMDLSFPGFWQDTSTLNVAMRWACVDQYGQDGVYTIDLESNSAERNPELSSDDGSMATHVNYAGRYSVKYPTSDFVIFINEKPSVDGVLISLPNSASLRRTAEPSMLITFQHFQLMEEIDLSEFVAMEDSCAAGYPEEEFQNLGQIPAVLYRDALCGPYGYSLVAALHDEFGYLITIESHARFENIEETVNAILETFMTHR